MTAPCGASRRTVVAAGCLLAVAGVAGCARYSEDGGSPSGPSPPPGPPPDAGPPDDGGDPGAGGAAGGGTAGGGGSGGGTAGGGGSGGIPTSSVPVGGGVVLADQGVVLTQPTAGTFAAFGTRCPHQGCSVNAVADGTINCPCHGSRFAIADGSVTDGPAPRGLDRRQVTVTGSTLALG